MSDPGQQLSIWGIIMLLEISLILVLVVAYSVCAGTDGALIAARRGRLQQSADQGHQSAMVAIRLQDDAYQLLSTVRATLVLIAILIGALGGLNLTTALIGWLRPLPVVGIYAEYVSLALVVFSITCLVLVLGEVVPRRLTLQNAEAFVIRIARPMLCFTWLGRPLVMLVMGCSEGVLWLLGRRSVAAEPVTEDDIRQIVREGAQGGIVAPEEQELIESVFEFSTLVVRHIMTPRRDVYALESEALLGDVLDDLLESGFSRFPVYDQDLDHVVGIVHVRDLLRSYRADGANIPVRTMMYRPVFVPESGRAAVLLATFRKSKQHMAIVVSEHGGVEGVVTLEDVLEKLVGDIADEHDEAADRALIEREDGSLLIDGLLPIDEFKQHLNLKALPGEEVYRFDTLAGFVLSLFGQIPRTGDVVRWSDWRFEVVDMDGLRIDKILALREVNPSRK